MKKILQILNKYNCVSVIMVSLLASKAVSRSRVQPKIIKLVFALTCLCIPPDNKNILGWEQY
jgi:hypothetical protein